jgi:CRP/FNR family transcriptional regulator
MTNWENLKPVPLFASLSEDELRRISPLFRKRRLKKDTYIVMEGDPPDYLYIVLAGRVKLIKHAGGKDVILHLVSPGEWFGGVAAFGRRNHPFTAQTMEATTILEVAGRDFAELMARYPSISNEVIQELVERLTEAHEMMKRLAVEPVERRIAHTLHRLANKVGEPGDDGLTLNIHLTRQDIAEMAGTTVETTIRVLSQWRKSGLVHMSGGHVVISEPERLWAIAEKL